jgi:hypothetical protein
VGETVAEPESAVLLTPLSILTDDVFVVDQVRTDDWPRVMLAGLAVNWMDGSGKAALTEIMTVALVVPPGPVADKT